MFTKKTVHDIDVAGKIILYRVDYNVLDKKGNITESLRLEATVPTIKHLLEQNCKIVMLTCAGRPEGKVVPELSLKPIAARMSEIVGQEIKFVDDCVGPKVAEAVQAMQPKDIVMLENTRFYPGDEANDDEFSKQLAEGKELFVDDAFGQAHRPYASVTGVAQHLPAVAGLLMEKEVDTITNVMADPERPLVAVVGGAKVSDKIEVLEKFVELADVVVVVGAMANTFMLANGVKVGKSLVEPDKVDVAKAVMAKAKEKAAQQAFTFYIPTDVVVAAEVENNVPTRLVDLANHTFSDIESYPKMPDETSYTVADDELILDVGPLSASLAAGMIRMAKTVVWNGTAGVAELKGLHGAADPFGHGTKIIVDAIIGESRNAKNKPFSLVGGGDTAAYIESKDLLADFNHVSTGGGACLELMSGKNLPGVDALLDKDS